MDVNNQYLDEHPEYIEILDKIIKLEQNLDPEDFKDRGSLERFNDNNDTDHDVYWRNTDIAAHPSKLYQLEINGFIDRVVDTNSTTCYSMSDYREEIAELVTEFKNKYDDGTRIEMHDFPDEDELEEMGIFDDVVGYDDIKFLMRRAMTADDIVNILLVGPKGSAKTVFLMCINKLDNSEYISGKPTTGPGFYDVMFDETPRYVAIDEIDNADSGTQKALADYTETGILVEAKGNNKRRKMKTNTKTFAAANRINDIVDEIANRFVDLHFEPYTRNEFIEVCEHIIPRNENKSKNEATKIAKAVWDFEGFGNVRKALQAARLSRGDPEKILGILDDYSANEKRLLNAV